MPCVSPPCFNPDPILRSCLDQPSRHSLNITSYNIDGLKFNGENKMESPSFAEISRNRDVIFLCETHARHETLEASVPPGFSCFGASGIKTRGQNKGRLSNGMAFLVRSELAPKTTHEFKSSFVLAIRIHMNQMNSAPLYIIGCYVPPENSKYYESDIWDEIKLLITRYQAKGDIVVVGDFNARTESMQTSHLRAPQESIRMGRKTGMASV